MIPSAAQLKQVGLTAEEYQRRNRIWHRMLRQCEPDVRERICADPLSQEAVALAVSVENEIIEEDRLAKPTLLKCVLNDFGGHQ